MGRPDPDLISGASGRRVSLAEPFLFHSNSVLLRSSHWISTGLVSCRFRSSWLESIAGSPPSLFLHRGSSPGSSAAAGSPCSGLRFAAAASKRGSDFSCDRLQEPGGCPSAGC